MGRHVPRFCQLVILEVASVTSVTFKALATNMSVELDEESDSVDIFLPSVHNHGLTIPHEAPPPPYAVVDENEVVDELDELNSSNDDEVVQPEPPKRKRGRPKGSTKKVEELKGKETPKKKTKITSEGVYYQNSTLYILEANCFFDLPLAESTEPTDMPIVMDCYKGGNEETQTHRASFSLSIDELADFLHEKIGCTDANPKPKLLWKLHPKYATGKQFGLDTEEKWDILKQQYTAATLGNRKKTYEVVLCLEAHVSRITL